MCDNSGIIARQGGLARAELCLGNAEKCMIGIGGFTAAATHCASGATSRRLSEDKCWAPPSCV